MAPAPRSRGDPPSLRLSCPGLSRASIPTPQRTEQAEPWALGTSPRVTVKKVDATKKAGGASPSARLLQRRRGGRHGHVDDLQVGLDDALAAVLEGDFGFHVGRAGVGVERLDEPTV